MRIIVALTRLFDTCQYHAAYVAITKTRSRYTWRCLVDRRVFVFYSLVIADGTRAMSIDPLSTCIVAKRQDD
ncbi:unnamed protein product [Sphenostylis stenocarpa]|uniref:Uncharacterized protein n=1 Tax=Sphenostylis stenocarpa TaxID=92480 RepID=A0AA87B8W2_9FABA|nr:unnamed protein product [Sphenostylis stenocarpa]